MQTADIIPISILVRTFNSARSLGCLFPGLKIAPGDEIIVVDSGSTDETLAVAASYGARVVKAEGRFNYSKSLNLGFRAARNPWVLVISSHTVSLVSDLLGVFRSVARDLPDKVVVVYGFNTLTGRASGNDTTVRYYTLETYSNSVKELCGNANTLYRCSIWEKFHFDESIRTGEDRIWLEETLKHGYGLGIAPGARTLNQSRYSPCYMFMKGYSDQRALPHRPMSPLSLAWGLGSLTKKFLRGGMPAGNYIRGSAQNLGSFLGSYQKQDNTPEKGE